MNKDEIKFRVMSTPAPKEILKVCSNGDVYYHGDLIDKSDKETLGRIREELGEEVMEEIGE